MCTVTVERVLREFSAMSRTLDRERCSIEDAIVTVDRLRRPTSAGTTPPGRRLQG